MPGLLNPFVAGVPTTLYDAAVLADTPLVYYRGEEPSGSTAVDYSGNSRDGTYQAVTLAQASLLTSGEGMSGSYPAVNTPTGAGLINRASATWMDQTAFCVEAVIRTGSNVSGSFILATRDDLGFSSIPSNRAWLLRINGSRLNASVNAAGEVNISPAASLAINTTYHVAMRFTGALLEGYINGVLGSSVAYATVPGAKTAPLRVGHHHDTTGANVWNFNGRIQKFAYYSGALSAARIAAHAALR
jgi:hypothetical protein